MQLGTASTQTGSLKVSTAGNGLVTSGRCFIDQDLLAGAAVPMQLQADFFAWCSNVPHDCSSANHLHPWFWTASTIYRSIQASGLGVLTFSIPACCQLSQIPFPPHPVIPLRTSPVLRRSWSTLGKLELKKNSNRIQKEHKLSSHLYLDIDSCCHFNTQTFFFFRSTDSLILVVLGIHKRKWTQFNIFDVFVRKPFVEFE